MRRIFLASGAMSIKIPDKIETILINIHQRLRANPPHASPRLARSDEEGRGHVEKVFNTDIDTVMNTQYTQHIQRRCQLVSAFFLQTFRISCGDNLFQYLLSSGSFQQLPNAFSDDCVMCIYHSVIVKTETLAQYQMRMAGAWSAGTHGSLDVEYGMKDRRIRIQGLETWHLASQSLSSSPAHECEISSETILPLCSVGGCTIHHHVDWA